MKFLPAFIAAALLFSASSLHAQLSASQALTEGQRAFYGGNMELAKTRFMQVLEVDPKNPTATKFLVTIRTHEMTNVNPGAELEKKFKALVLPKVELRDVAVVDALDRLKQLGTKESGGKLGINFVVKLPQETLDQKITLSLVNVPFTEALKYLGELADLQFTFDKYAIGVRKKSGGGPAIETVVPPTPPGGAPGAPPGLAPQ